MGCSTCRWDRNCRVEALAEWPSTKGRGQVAGQRQGAATGGAQVLVQRRGRAIADHVQHDVAREGGDRRAAGERFQHDQSEGVGQAREHRHVAGGVGAHQIVAGFRPEEFHRGYFLASASRAGPGPTTTLVPGRSSDRKASMFFSIDTRPT